MNCEYCGKPMTLLPVEVGSGAKPDDKPRYMHPRCVAERRKQVADDQAVIAKIAISKGPT